MKILRSRLTPEELRRDDRSSAAAGWVAIWLALGLLWFSTAGLTVSLVIAVARGERYEPLWLPVGFWVMSIAMTVGLVAMRRWASRY